MNYRYQVIADGDQLMARFPDIPEAVTGAYTLDELHELAEDVLLSSFDFYFEDNRAVPMPTPQEDGDYVVSVAPSVAAKILLLNTMLEQHITQAELAKRMSTRPQELQRIVDLGHSTKIDTIERALAAMGKHLSLSIC